MTGLIADRLAEHGIDELVHRWKVANDAWDVVGEELWAMTDWVALCDDCLFLVLACAAAESSGEEGAVRGTVRGRHPWLYKTEKKGGRESTSKRRNFREQRGR